MFSAGQRLDEAVQDADAVLGAVLDDSHVEDPRTYAIIGAAMEVHRELGPGYLEVVYHAALLRELANRGIGAQSEVPLQVYSKGQPLGHPYRADIVTHDGVVIEIKAHSGLGDADLAQTLHYLRATRMATGLLVNFGRRSLQQKRVVLGDEWKERIGGSPMAPGPATD